MKNNYINLRNVFKDYKVFNIPYYQRKYVWNTVNKGRNLYKFVDDICNEYVQSQQSSYFIGSIAFCSHDNVVDVVDGQQRLTSIITLLSVLAEFMCSTDYKNKHRKFLYVNNRFVIQEPYYLTAELEGVFGYNKSYTGTGFKVKLDETVVKIKQQLQKNWGNFSVNQFNGLYDYILDNVYVIVVEYNNVKDALRYFLNINSLSVQLTQSEIFYTILSQSLMISHNQREINNIIAEIDQIVQDNKKAFKSSEDILNVFVNTYYAKDANIGDLDEIGVGKWLSYYHVDVFSDAISAQSFCRTFLAFLNDFKYIVDLFQYKINRNESSPLYLSYLLLNYENYSDMVQFLTVIFKNRHNYNNHDLYTKNGDNIDIGKVEDISKRLNITLLHNYIRDSNKRLDGFISNIELDSLGKPKLTLKQIINNINLESIFTLNFLNSFQSYPKINISDKSRLIKVIFALQEAFLNYVANPNISLYRYFADIIQAQRFTIEHLYSIKEFTDNDRLKNWNNEGKFNTANEFDTERAKFENLSLLNFNANSTANDYNIYDKLNIYRTAAMIMTSENEYLIQSLVPNSPFYSNEKIKELGLPNRAISKIKINIWEHSINNREFNTKLLRLALEKIV